MPRLDRQYYGWLGSLNMGDPVAVRNDSEYYITTVKSITGWNRNIKVKSDIL